MPTLTLTPNPYIVVFAGNVRASVSVSPSTALLQGQTQAVSDTGGHFNITDLLLTAPPGTLNVSVTLQDEPLVSCCPLALFIGPSS